VGHSRSGERRRKDKTGHRKKASDTYGLERAEEGTSQGSKRRRLTEGHSLAEERGGRDKS
jgi:hypothetical protein